MAQSILDSIGRAITLFDGGSNPPCSPLPRSDRMSVSLTERYYPSLVVLSHNEITPNLKVRSLGTVTLDAS